ncbi:hypothetical protein BD310DRAFT_929422 [Dichomitus squalens]|uniref:Uncharacterized protein n=1 Tax=Dichomitus squalens TaxID=114155 RepID=A0A4Q9PSR7_9APHY|nr:hypothetical protein BD310DRAFT_929422 [Dichomitus squalens]
MSVVATGLTLCPYGNQRRPTHVYVGRLSMSRISYDWLARDHNVDSHVYLILHRPLGSNAPYRWGITWAVGGLATNEVPAWRTVQLETLADPYGGELEPHYVYLGAITRTVAPSTLSTRLYDLGMLSLAQRRVVEQVAQDVEVDGRDSQSWVTELLKRLTSLGVLSKDRCEGVLSRIVSA